MFSFSFCSCSISISFRSYSRPFFSPPTVAGEIQWIIDTGCIFQLLGIQFPVSAPVNWLVFMFSNLFLITFFFFFPIFILSVLHFLSVFFQPCLFIVCIKCSEIKPTQGSERWCCWRGGVGSWQQLKLLLNGNTYSMNHSIKSKCPYWETT